MSRDADTAAVNRVLQGDVDAFESIVQRWQSPLVNLAYRYCRDYYEAQDMAQEAFLKIFAGLHSWRGEKALSTWLLSVAVNSYRSHLRTRKRSCVVRLVDPGLDQLADPSRSEDGETGEWVRHAVTRLPPKYRDVIVLFYFREKDLKEVAGILGLPEGTAKARLHRGRELLRRRLEAARLG